MLRGIRSNDLIPLGYIRLSEAFERYYQAVTPSWHELNAAIDATNPPEGEINAAASRKLDTARGEAFNARDIARGEADKKFREAIAAGKLQPMNRDPGSGGHMRCQAEEVHKDRPQNRQQWRIENLFPVPPGIATGQEHNHQRPEARLDADIMDEQHTRGFLVEQ